MAIALQTPVAIQQQAIRREQLLEFRSGAARALEAVLLRLGRTAKQLLIALERLPSEGPLIVESKRAVRSVRGALPQVLAVQPLPLRIDIPGVSGIQCEQRVEKVFGRRDRIVSALEDRPYLRIQRRIEHIDEQPRAGDGEDQQDEAANEPKRALGGG